MKSSPRGGRFFFLHRCYKCMSPWTHVIIQSQDVHCFSCLYCFSHLPYWYIINILQFYFEVYFISYQVKGYDAIHNICYINPFYHLMQVVLQLGKLFSRLLLTCSLINRNLPFFTVLTPYRATRSCCGTNSLRKVS